jgi:hypothetical protein
MERVKRMSLYAGFQFRYLELFSMVCAQAHGSSGPFVMILFSKTGVKFRQSAALAVPDG